ncbi:MAG: peptidylprolyl isomerase [Acidobacteriota bacterium]
MASFRAPITQAELERWIQGYGDTAPEDRQQALRELILSRVLAGEAVRLGLDRDPATRVELVLKDAALVRPSLVRDVNAGIHVSDAEVEAKYQSIKDTYTRPRRVRLRNLFRRYPPDADAEDRAEVRRHMEELRRRLVAGEDFAELAAAESDSQTRLQGGLLGNVRPGTLKPEVDAVAMAMQPGEISEILAGSDGLTLLYCEQILPKVHRSPEELRDIARSLLERYSYQERWAAFEEQLLAKAGPVTDWTALEQDLDATLVTFTGGSLSVGQVRSRVAGRRSQARLAEFPRSRVEAAITRFVTQAMMLPEAAARGLIDAELEDRMAIKRREILASKALAYLIQQRLQPPTEAEIAALYRASPETFVRPPHDQLAVLSLRIDPSDPRPAYRLGERILHRLGLGELSFAEAARRHSDHPSATQGGEVGWVARRAISGRFGIDFMRALKRMKPGERSDLVASEGRLWIIELRAVEDQRTMTFEEARSSAEQRLGNQRVRQLEAEIVAEWLERLDIRFPDDAD